MSGITVKVVTGGVCLTIENGAYYMVVDLSPAQASQIGRQLLVAANQTVTCSSLDELLKQLT